METPVWSFEVHLSIDLMQLVKTTRTIIESLSFKKDREALTWTGINIYLCKLATDTGLSPLLCDVLKFIFPLISWSWWKTQESLQQSSRFKKDRETLTWTGISISLQARHWYRPEPLFVNVWSFEVHLSIDLRSCWGISSTCKVSAPASWSRCYWWENVFF